MSSASDTHVFTPETLAASWGEPWTPAWVRRLCREHYIPARKAGPKPWLIPAAEQNTTAPIATLSATA